MHPMARRTDIIVQALGDGVLVYDEQRDAAHSLNAAAAVVYEHADGTRSVDELAIVLGERLGVPRDGALVEVALRELQGAGLLEAPAVQVRGVSRRELVRRLGIAAAALPIVVSVGAPTPLMAQSHSLSNPSNPSPPSGGLPNQKPSGPKPSGPSNKPNDKPDTKPNDKPNDKPNNKPNDKPDNKPPVKPNPSNQGNGPKGAK